MKTLFFTILLSFPMLAFGQTVHGKVLDAEGMPLKGVRVVATGTNIGAATDDEGAYLLNLPNGNQVTEIVFTYREYKKPLEVDLPNGIRTDTRIFVTMHKKKRKRNVQIVD
jgi:hypothetical protein